MRPFKLQKKGFIDIIYQNPKWFQNFTKAMLKPTTPRAVLLTRSNKQQFKDMPSDVPFDGTTVAVEYRLTHPPFKAHEGFSVLEDLSFYLTRKLSSPYLKPFLSTLDSDIVKQKTEDQRGLLYGLYALYFEGVCQVRITPFLKPILWSSAVKLGSVVAWNNLGIFLSENDSALAEELYKTAADRGFSPALRNYSFLLRDKKADPRQIKPYLKMAGLLGEFRTQDNNFASGLLFEPPSLEEAFANVWFEGPQPHCIKLKKSVKVAGGNLEVHFRDANHLRCLIEHTPNLEADHVYFILDQNARDGEEFIAQTGILEQGKFVHVMADKPLELRGSLTLQHPLVLPFQSNLNSFSLKGTSYGTSLYCYEEGQALADALDSFDPAILVSKTAEARRLLQERKVDRIQHPEKYPDLDTMTPDAYRCYSGEISIEDNDYLESSSSTLYIASSIEGVERISRELKTFTDYAFFISPSATDAGVYNLNPFFLRRGFKLSSTKDLFIAGEYELPNEHFVIEAGRDLWLLAPDISVGGGLRFLAFQDLYRIRIGSGGYRPADMPPQVWQSFKPFALRQYGIRLGD